jgi:hypothetical protein
MMRFASRLLFAPSPYGSDTSGTVFFFLCLLRRVGATVADIGWWSWTGGRARTMILPRPGG